MVKRPRRHIPMQEIAASALADKLPQAQRDDLRARKVSAKQVIRLFTPDHVKLHAWGGSDKWWNIDMRQRGPELKAKDSADTSRAAKAVRIDRINQEAQRRLLAKSKGGPRPQGRAFKQRWPSRPFPKRINQTRRVASNEKN